MGFTNEVFKKATIQGLTAYLLYDSAIKKDNEPYEIRLDKSYEQFKEVALQYDDNTESKLIHSVNELIGDVSEIYTEIGL